MYADTQHFTEMSLCLDKKNCHGKFSTVLIPALNSHDTPKESREDKTSYFPEEKVCLCWHNTTLTPALLSTASTSGFYDIVIGLLPSNIYFPPKIHATMALLP